MTVKDQIPTFPRLISMQDVVYEVAHGTTNYQRIFAKYYSTDEKMYAEELATARIRGLLQQADIQATGRESTIRKGSADRWEAQQYKQHSKVRTYIEPEFWRSSVFTKSARFNTARIDGQEYTDILLVLDDCVKTLAEDVAAHRESAARDNESEGPNSKYSTPYIDLMRRVIDHFEISPENQPIKENLVEWLLAQKIAGQCVSRSTAEYLASFVRLPESRAGGNRPWKVRAQQHSQDE
jgi:hypothetical protein